MQKQDYGALLYEQIIFRHLKNKKVIHIRFKKLH